MPYRPEYKTTVIKAAREAGTLLRRSLGKIKEISYKGGVKINLVTNVDRQAEQLIIKKLKKSFPGHGVLGEETGLSSNKKSGYIWVIDPIDGTTNFVHGFEFFCVSIALTFNGRTILGAVYEPMRDELFFARKNGGAYLNGKAIKVSKTRDILGSMLATGFAYTLGSAKNNNIRNFINFLKSAQAIRRAGSAALDLCYVAAGRFDGFWELNLQPWDTAAGTLIVEEAGGKVTKFSNDKYSIFDKEILASNGLIHKQMVRILSRGSRREFKV